MERINEQRVTVGGTEISKPTEWNTGRLYDDRGQVMRAAFLGYDRIVFVDTSRNIDGIIHGQFGRLSEEPERYLQEKVMVAYDHDLFSYARDHEEREAVTWLKNLKDRN